MERAYFDRQMAAFASGQEAGKDDLKGANACPFGHNEPRLRNAWLDGFLMAQTNRSTHQEAVND